MKKKIVIILLLLIALQIPVRIVSAEVPGDMMDYGQLDGGSDHRLFDPFAGLRGAFNFSNWGDSIKAATLPVTTLGGAILGLLTFNIREGMEQLIFQPLEHKLFHTSTDIIDSKAFASLLKLFTNLCTSCIVLIFIYNAFKLIFNRQATAFPTLIMKCLIGIAYLNLVPFVVKKIIWFNNLLCQKVIEFVGGPGVFQPLMHPVVGFINIFIFTVIFIVFSIKLLLYYFGRDYIITLLILISPFIWFLWIDDDLKHNATIWFKHLIIIIFTQFVHCIQLAIFSVLVIGLGGSAETFWGSVENTIFSVIAMSYMVKTPAFIKQFTYELSTGGAANAINTTARFVTFAAERKAIKAILSKIILRK